MIDESNFYLRRFRYCDAQIGTAPAPGLGMVVVIPTFSEPELLRSLASLKACTPPAQPVEVIVVVNCGAHLDSPVREENRAQAQAAREWAQAHSSEALRFHVLEHLDLPRKHAGVGLARKIGMDEAVRRLEWAERPEGVIVCFDADSEVEPNYLQALEAHFLAHPKSPGCSIHYEHPLEGPLSPAHYQGILNYEIHLRYYVHGLQFAGHPHAHQTIGSSMAVRSTAYQKQGGMNRRKAGEDFYFLHKIIPLGHFSELTATMVIPSPRQSERVPFGTGKAIGSYLEQEDPEAYLSYHPQVYADLKTFLDTQKALFSTAELPWSSWAPSIQRFLQEQQFETHWKEMKRQSRQESSFKKRFYTWMDGFKVLKFVHFARDHFHPNVEVKDGVLGLEKMYPRLGLESFIQKKDILLRQRRLDRGEG